MKKHYGLILIFGYFGLQLNAQKYFVTFSDKSNNTFSISNPELFLSQRAIERRKNQRITITEEDLPVTTSYVDSIRKMGVKVYCTSKWLNGVIIESSNSQLMDTIIRVSFIDDYKLIWKAKTSKTFKKFNDSISIQNKTLKNATDYGQAWTQTETINGHFLHQNTYEGENMLIAIIDNGFSGVDHLPSFEQLWNNNQIKDTVNFINPGTTVFENVGNHGMMVLSIMGGYMDGEIKGSAPKASYLLLCSEDIASEYPIEEYNWVCAAEYADSSGADIINSSLGYYTFDDPSMNYSYDDMDGQTTICVKGAEIAFSKGMIIISSAGNEGVNNWKYIISPSDGLNVLAVAAMQKDSSRAVFSSYGPSADDRIKPDITALGEQTALQNTDGNISFGNGTSFSAPIISGFVTCLWQAKRQLNNIEIIDIIKKSSHNYLNPDNSFGYGIPDFKKALDFTNGISNLLASQPYQIKPNPFNHYLNISNSTGNLITAIVDLYDISGNLVFSQSYTMEQSIKVDQLQHLSAGIYLMRIKDHTQHFTYKLFKK